MKPSGNDNRVMQGVFLKAVQDQLKKNDPPETAQTLQRLLSEDIPERDALNMIALCLASEVTAGIKSDEPFNTTRFILKLNELPGEFL
ncbi:MAG: hypothetical protein HUU01_20930 [Saprospiraceae bacterium]|nr:hypothetical protein [Saprospiraceae bacterium]